MWLVVGSLVPSLVVSWTAGWLVRQWGPRWGLVDRPGARKIHAAPMPTAGGLAIWLGIVVPLAIGQLALWLMAETSLPLVEIHRGGLWQQSDKLWTMLAGGTVLMILGLADDRRGLDWRLRLTVQTAVAVAMVMCGWRLTLFLDVPLVTGIISVVWIVGLVNSFNMLDNMDGLSAGVAAIAGTLLALLMLAVPSPATHQPQLFIGGFLLVFVGSLAGFLGHNRPPARLFMGDTGSYLIGYLLAMMTLTATFAGNDVPRHAVLTPLCILAIPLYDMTSVIFIRLGAGRSPFVGDKSHFSHRLVDLGMTKPQAVLTIYLATATCGLGAFVLHQVDTFGACLVLLLEACVLVLVAILEAAGRLKLRAGGPETPKAGRLSQLENIEGDGNHAKALNSCSKSSPLPSGTDRGLVGRGGGGEGGV
jgi:UDP-GlcNAc:undecaprenyl-phosphate GlcNAc-1-phosphate transferase